MHRNTFLNSPKLLNATLQYRKNPNWFFAGQLVGTEGYIESAADGIVAGINAARHVQKRSLLQLPTNTMMGALLAYISNPANTHFQPMGCNMGILPPWESKIRDKKERYLAIANRAVASMKNYMAEEGV